MISPLYVHCHQHQNIIKGKIALSISPFLVVDDNIHIAPKIIQKFAFGGSKFYNEPPLNVCIYDSLLLHKMHTFWGESQYMISRQAIIDYGDGKLDCTET